ncbi:ABC transporter permease [Virgibacillus sp. NKC19-3]|uniref:ABC transporter permease n=1 Tax=Virgibacillus saliphilus TaxID=2831674 RepID=UPI001C9A4016|nr:ABC transporter permease [Virgibacillus sp. NKC19-3]MBY7144800.1 ABC transporter permease [Virgibacillus sp. NKC19-3]
MHVQRISAIFEKDIKDFMKNMMLLMMPVIPIVLALIYTRMGSGDEDLPIIMLYIIIGVTYSAVTSSTIMTMMAEESEKKTLRGLIQSPASMMDIIIGKSLVTGLITFVSLIVSLVILDIEPFLHVRAMLGLLLIFLFFLFLGIGIGLFAKSIASTSFYIMPIMFLFGFTPFIWMLGLDEDGIVIKIADTFPIMQGIEIHDTTSWLPLGIITIWTAAAAVFMYVCFKKTMTDD